MGNGSKNGNSTREVKMSDSSSYFKVYEEYMKTLRAWFVAFGIGAPALFITQAHLTEPLIKSGQAVCIAILFLGGMAIQIGIAALNKWINWYLYYGEENPDLKDTVTLRERDSMKQERIAIADLPMFLLEKIR